MSILQEFLNRKKFWKSLVFERLFQKRSSVMNGSEREFFRELQKQLPRGYYVFPKMRIADIIDAPEGFNFQVRKYYILPRHIDFIVCDSNLAPVVGVEVNGPSHDLPSIVMRDKRVKEIFEAAGLPLEMIKVGTRFEEEIKRVLTHLSEHTKD